MILGDGTVSVIFIGAIDRSQHPEQIQPVPKDFQIDNNYSG